MSNPAEKQCGDCSLCCKVMAVTELNKPKDRWCDHVIRKRGCGIYQARPPSCRAFQCLWLQDSHLAPEWKPSKAKFVMVGDSRTELVVHVDAGAAGAWRAEPYFSVLRAMAERGQSQGMLVVIMERGESTVLLADREIELGALDEDERLVSGLVATPSGPRFEVKVMKTGEADRLVATVSRQRQPQ